MKGTEQHHGNKLEDTSFDEPSIPSSPAPSYVELPSTSVDAYSQPIGNDAKIRDDGRVEIDGNSKLMRTLTALHRHSDLQAKGSKPEPQPSTTTEAFSNELPWATKLNIVIQFVGSRGDVQPFVALGNELQRHGHRVRLATHNVFGQFVRDAGLEFFPVGGDPAELMAYMVKNPGLIPSMASLTDGEIQKKRYMVQEMLGNFWESCLARDPQTGEPFVADAIIGNPPSFAHIHCAQALGIPVHLMFTMPWSSTRSFPHPLANLKNLTMDPKLTYYMSYDVVEWMTWQGLGDIINRFRKSIDLEEVAMFDGPFLTKTLKIPFTYCWSPALVPKPADWPSHIDICGFFFRDPPQYSPPPELVKFLDQGPQPVYIGFGSIVLDEPERIVNTILDALRVTGIRAIISKGWSDLAGSTEDNIYWIGDCPHEWLFQHVAGVVHHGGAGTTACGLRYGRPTAIVPFFGDQPFWGDMVAKAGAGPRPIPHANLTAENLAEALQYLVSKEAATAAESLASKMQSETGVQAAARSFHRQLPLEHIQCQVLPAEPAVWTYLKSDNRIRLSKVAAETLLSAGKVTAKELKIFQSKPIIIETTRWDPISGGASAMMATTTELTGHFAGIFTKPVEEWKDDRRRKLASEGEEVDPGHVGPNSRRDQLEEDKRKDLYDTRTSGDTESTKSTKVKHGSSMQVAGKMASASALSLANFAPSALNGMMVDIPLAITEGMRSVPRYYGGRVRDNGTVVDMKSGAVVAGKTFAWGFADGLSDVVMEPYKGARDEGAVGAVKGVGKGVGSLVTSTGAGMFGLFAYSSAGISKSIRAAVHSGTRKTVAKARHEEGGWMMRRGKADVQKPGEIVSTFVRLRDNAG